MCKEKIQGRDKQTCSNDRAGELWIADSVRLRVIAFLLFLIKASVLGASKLPRTCLAWNPSVRTTCRLWANERRRLEFRWQASNIQQQEQTYVAAFCRHPLVLCNEM